MGEFIGPGRRRDRLRQQRHDQQRRRAFGRDRSSIRPLLNDRGTFVDDCLVYRFADQVMMVVNASNAAKDWTTSALTRRTSRCALTDASDETALLALQGRWRSRCCSRSPTSTSSRSKYYHFASGSVAACLA
jgi:aminomethyltransferase